MYAFCTEKKTRCSLTVTYGENNVLCEDS